MTDQNQLREDEAFKKWRDAQKANARQRLEGDDWIDADDQEDGFRAGFRAALSQPAEASHLDTFVVVDMARRAAMARAVFDALRAECRWLGPWSAFDAEAIQSMADALKQFTVAAASQADGELLGYIPTDAIAQIKTAPRLITTGVPVLSYSAEGHTAIYTAPNTPVPEAGFGNMREAVATVESWTNGSYWRNYNLTWHRDVEAGTKLYTTPPAPDHTEQSLEMVATDAESVRRELFALTRRDVITDRDRVVIGAAIGVISRSRASLQEVVAYFDAPGDGCFSDAALQRARDAIHP